MKLWTGRSGIGESTKFQLINGEDNNDDDDDDDADEDDNEVSPVTNLKSLVVDRPDAPVNVELRRCSATVAEVSWHAGAHNNQPILDYTVEYNTSTHVHHEGAVVDADVHVAVIPLRPWANYSFRVTARSRLGVGRPSRPTAPVCSTPAAKPFRNPDAVCSNLTSSAQLFILWQVRRRISERRCMSFTLNIRRQSHQTQQQHAKVFVPISLRLMPSWISLDSLTIDRNTSFSSLSLSHQSRFYIIRPLR